MNQVLRRFVLPLTILAVWLVAVSPRTACAQLGPPASAPRSTPVVAPGIGVLQPGTVLGTEAGTDESAAMNPLLLLERAGRALPGVGASGSDDPKARGAGLSTAINIMIVLTVIGLVPSIMLMCTCFVRIVIVLGLLKQALGAAQMPPSQVMLGLSLIMTLLVMTPTIDRINAEAVTPWRDGRITDYSQLWDASKKPLHDFMMAQIQATGNWSSLYMILNYRGIDTSEPDKIELEKVDMVSLVPAYVLSELKVSFLMGFRVYLPFLVIDMVISSLLISMSMMMLPPVLISLPFKLLLFVLVDGWQLVCGSLMNSFVVTSAASGSGSVSVGAAAGPLLAALGPVARSIGLGV